jgi:hypothetical protein
MSMQSNPLENKADLTADSIANAPLPTARTLRARNSIPRQLVRFVAFNARMLRIVAHGHG